MFHGLKRQGIAKARIGNPCYAAGFQGSVVLALGFGVLGFSQEPAGRAPTQRSAIAPAKRPVQVKIQDDKPVIALPVLAVDPVPRVQYNVQQNMMVNVQVDRKTMHLGYIQTLFHVDGQVIYPGNPPGRMVLQNAPLPKKPGGRERPGVMSVYEINNVQITQTIEPVATRPVSTRSTGAVVGQAARLPGSASAGAKRSIDTVLVNYLVNNKDNRPHKVGLRIFMDVFIVDNDGALFAAPNHPGRILNGVELKDKKIPDYLQFLQRPNLQNPGFVAHMTLNFGRHFEKPDRAVLTQLGAFAGQWDILAQPAGDSAMAVFWDPKDIKAKSKKNMAYAYGAGIAANPEGDGLVNLVLGGSFEPGKLFTISAYVQDPAPGQSLTLDLPPGMERVEGKQIQPVPTLSEEEGNAMVLWKARVLRIGQYNLRVRSSTGMTQTKVITISRPGEKASGP